MKILYISGANFPSEVSHTLSKMRMCQALTDAGHDVTLSAFGKSEFESNIIEYYGLKGGFSLNLINIPFWLDNPWLKKIHLHKLYAAFCNRGVINRFKPDIIYSRLTLFELIFIPKGLSVIYEMHSLGFLGKKWPAPSLFKLLVSRKSFVRFVSSTNALACLLRAKFPKKDIVIARLSAELPIEIDTIKLSDFKNKQLQGQQFEHHVGYTGYLDTVGLRGTEIICQLAVEIPNIAFHIVGGDKTAVKHWKELKKCNTSNNNLFFYGHRNSSEIPYFLNCFDVVLAPLQHRPTSRAPIGENMSPLKLPQYMAYKKAIIASDLPAHREILDEKRTALLVKCDNIDAWVMAVKSLIKSPDRRNNMGLRAYHDYLKSYTPAGRVRSIIDKDML